jgi:hypothetical protein
VNDAFSREHKKLQKKSRKLHPPDSFNEKSDGGNATKIAIKCGDGKWSTPIKIPDGGTSYGVVKVVASRWPYLTNKNRNNSPMNTTVKKMSRSPDDAPGNFVFKPACLNPDLFELCYSIADVEGEWGEFSRTMEVSPRFIVRNDSKSICMKVKQAGSPDSTCLRLMPGVASPFYWSDFRLPKLVSVMPLHEFDADQNIYRWSGGFDLCNLGMTPIRIRNEAVAKDVDGSKLITSIRSLVEVRPKTGGTGINVSFREESDDGEGSLFRIENLTPFPIWLAQDGVLANPTASIRQGTSPTNTLTTAIDCYSQIDGDLLRPNAKTTFALDIPYRQGKYSHRKEATLSELLQVRVALAPLSSRTGIEMVKMIGLTTVGESVRLNPCSLPLILPETVREKLRNIRVLGVVASDGPTRVLRFW